MENKKQEEMVKEAVEEAKKAAQEAAEEKAEQAQEAAESAQEAASEEQTEEAEVSEEAEGAEEAETEAGENAKEKKGFFKKKNKKDPRDEKIEVLTDKLTRQMAEFDNYRKRTEKEKSAMYEIGAKDIIEHILPVIDNFERGFQSLSEEQKKEPFADGMDKIYRQLMTTLEDLGVRAIEAVGQEFDPNFHNAVMHVEDEEAGENIVVEEFQKGYMYRESVVRHSMVKVAN